MCVAGVWEMHVARAPNPRPFLALGDRLTRRLTTNVGLQAEASHIALGSSMPTRLAFRDGPGVNEPATLIKRISALTDLRVRCLADNA